MWIKDNQHKKQVFQQNCTKNESGSITLFVLIGLLFFTIVSVNVYTSNSNKIQSQQRELSKTGQEYQISDEEINEKYEDIITDETTEMQIILSKVSDGSRYVEGTWVNESLKLKVIYPSKLQNEDRYVTINDVREPYQENKIINTSSEIKATALGRKVMATAKIDKTAPTITFSQNGGIYGIHAAETVTMVTSAKIEDHGPEKGISGAKKGVEYVWTTTAQEPTEGWQAIPSEEQLTKSVTEAGVYYLWVKGWDEAGNETKVMSKPFIIKAEQSLITITPSTTEFTNQDVIAKVVYEDRLQQKKAGVGTTLEQAKENKQDKTNYRETITVQQNGFVYAEASDTANKTITKDLAITNIDKIPPTVTITPNGGANYTMPTVGKAKIQAKLQAQDQGVSGLNTLQYAWSKSNSIEPTNWTNFTNGETINKTDCEVGNYYLWTKVTDKAGNRATATKVSNAFTIIHSEITFSYQPTGWTNQDITVRVNYGTGLTQNRKAGFGSATTANATTVLVTQNGTVYAEATDIVGNKVTAQLTIGTIDKTLPTVTLNPNGGTKYTMPTSGKATIKTTLTAADQGGSGLNTLQYAWSTSNTTEPTTWTNFTSGSTISKTDCTAGNYYLWTKVTDKAGNRAATTKVSNVFTVNSNTSAGSKITLTPNTTAWTNQNVTVSVTYGAYLTQNRKAGVGSASTANATTVTVTANGTVYAEATDIAGNKVTANLAITNIDKTLPTVSLNPNGGTKYTMPTSGNATIKTTLTAADQGGSGLNTLQYAWSTSNTTEPTTWTNFTSGSAVSKTDCTAGNYYLWTKVTDKAGNRAATTKVSSVFTVNANTSAGSKITLTPSTTAWTNQNVTVTVVYGEYLTQNKKAGVGSASTANATTVIVTANGTVYAEATDIAGNKVTANLAVGNIDKTLPTVTLNPNGGTKYTMPTSGKATIKTILTAADQGGSGLNTLQYAWSTSNTTEPTTWTTFTSGSTVSKTDCTAGNYYLWTKVTDKAGNRATTTKVSNVFTVNANTSAGSKITLTPSTTNWTNQNVTVTVAYGANLTNNRKAGVGSATTANATSVIVSSNGTVYAEATDVAGNKVIANLKITNIDKVAPVLSDITNSTNGNWTNDKVTLSWKITEGESGIQKVEYSYDGKTWPGSLVESEWYGLTRGDERNGALYLRVTDKAGNMSNVKSTMLKIDKTKPTTPVITNPSNGNWTNGDVKITLTSSDSASGIKQFEWFENGAWTTRALTTSGNSATITYTVNRDVTIRYRVIDNAGNSSEEATTVVRIDKNVPSVTLSPNGGTTYTMPTSGKAMIKTTLSASDSGGSGLTVLQYAWSTSNTTEPTTWTNFTNGSVVSKTDCTVGNYYLWTKVMDKAGNRATSIKVSNVFTVNANTAAGSKITLTPNTTAWTNQNVTVSVTYGAYLTQNRKAGVGSATTANSTTVTVTANGTVYAEATDIAGNKVTASLAVGNIDKTLPTVSLNPNGGTKYTMPTSGNATIKTILTAADQGGSGLNTLQYAWSTSNTTEPTSWTTFTSGSTVSKTDCTAGNYYLWTKVTDKAGNRAATTKVSNVFTVNSNTSAASKITLTSNTTAWTNQNVTVTVAYGANLTNNRKAGVGSASTANATSVAVTANGRVYAEATDVAGNKVTANLAVGNIDKTLPTVSFSPNGGNYVKPTSGNATIKTTLSASDSGGSTLNVLQYAWSTSNTTEPTTWTNFTSGSTISKTDCAVGSYYLWTKVTDKAGNRATTGKISNVFKVNTTSITLTPNITGWTNGNVTVSVTYGSYLTANKKAGVGSASTANATSVTVTANGTVYAEATDSVGNKVTASRSITNIDKTLPTVSMGTNGGGFVKPTSGNATIKTTLSASDTGGSGLSTLQYAWSTSNTTEPTSWTNFTSGSTVSKTDCVVGNYYLWTKVTDKAGNRATTIKISNAFSVVSSSITLTPNTTGWTNGNVTVTVAYGTYLTQNRKAGVGSANTANSTTVTVTANGTVYAEATDSIGNKVTASRGITNIDKTLPTASFSPNGGNYVKPTSGNATIKTTLSASDTGGSTLNVLQYAWSTSNTTEPTSWTNFSSGSTISKTDCAVGNYYLWTKVTDKAGNRATTGKVSSVFKVNSTSITLTPNITGWTNGNVTVSVTYGSYLTANKKAGVGSASTANATSVTVTANGTVYAEATDSIGNKVTASRAITNIDKTLPTVSFSPNGGNYVKPTSGNATIKTTLSASDSGGSTLNVLQYAWSTSNTTEPSTWTNFSSGSTISKTDCAVGNYYLWTKVTDKAGNRATTGKVSSVFKVNSTSITLTPNTTSWTNGNVTVSVTYGSYLTANKKAGVGSASTANATSVTVTANGTVYAEATDSVGNKVTASRSITNIDKTLPTVSLSPNGGNYVKPTSGNATIRTTLSASDSGGSTLNVLQYAWGASNTTEPTSWTNFTSGSTISKTDCAVGNYYLWTKVIDKAGNRATNIKVSGVFKINSVSITLTPNITSWTSGNVTVTVGYGSYLTANRKAGVGSANTANATTVTVTANGTVYAEATDSIGNKVTASRAVTNIDKTTPTVALGTNGGTFYMSQSASTLSISTKLTAANSGGSGLSTLQYAWSTSNTTEPTSWTNFSNGATVSYSAGASTYYVWTKVINGAGTRATSIKVSNAFTVRKTSLTGGTTKYVAKGNTITLSTSKNSYSGAVSWTTSNSNGAKLNATSGDSITVTGVTAGAYTVTAREANGGSTTSFTIQVTELTVSGDSTILEDSTKTLTAPTKSSNAGTVTYSVTSGTSYITVNSTTGLVTAKEGLAHYTDSVVTARESNGGATCTYKIRVKVWNGSGTSSDPYQIANVRDIKKLATKVDKSTATSSTTTGTAYRYQNYYFKQTVDINLAGSSSNQWNPIGNGYAITYFNGIYQGNNKTLSNLYKVSTTEEYVGLFSNLGSAATVSDLNISGTVQGRSYVGLLAGSSYGTISNGKSSGTVKGARDTGGIVGWATKTIQNCTNNATISGIKDAGASVNRYIGGIAGRGSNLQISSCTNTATVSYPSGFNEGGMTGGIVGQIDGNSTISNSVNRGSISGNFLTGGIAGYLYGNAKATSCTNRGAITGQSQQGGIAGGAAAQAGDKTTKPIIEKSCNVARITATYRNSKNSSYLSAANAGGIVGASNGVLINSCFNRGNVIPTNGGSSSYEGIGGIVGTACTWQIQNFVRRDEITNCYNTGTVGDTSVSTNVGGIVGLIRNVYVANCYSVGSIQSKSGGVKGGIYGHVETVLGKQSQTTNSYYSDGGARSYSNMTGTGTSKTRSQMLTMEGTLGSAYKTDSGNSINAGFPVLTWEVTAGKGWQETNGIWCWIDPVTGAKATGWRKLKERWYYFESNGNMATGWKQINNYWYYLTPSSGAMATGWLQLSGKWYYLKPAGFSGWSGPEGSMLANCSAKIGSKTYNFNSSGVCTNP